MPLDELASEQRPKDGQEGLPHDLTAQLHGLSQKLNVVNRIKIAFVRRRPRFRGEFGGIIFI